jgi:single-stranded DNA-binding protein
MLSNTTFVGRLTEKPTVRETRGGKRVATLRVAVNDQRMGEEPRYIDVDQWEEAADRAAAYLVSGQQVAVDALLDARPYTTSDGELRIGWTAVRARVEWGPKPLGAVPPELLADEALRRGHDSTAPAPDGAAA